jgi:hypothetical protein
MEAHQQEVTEQLTLAAEAVVVDHQEVKVELAVQV